MNRADALDTLPAPFAAALQLFEAGAATEAIAEAAGVPADAVVALIEVGEGKLAALLDLPDADGAR